MKTADALVARKIEEVRAEYEARGFEVLVDPGQEPVPFDLDGFLPELLARKGATNRLIVVRVSGMWASMERLIGLSGEVQRHPGWHLVLVTADDVELVGAPGLDDSL
ncbi:MAG TPA: hypothetical protein VGO40_13520, partial [Longimicrobium sp.]|nr:hypothetical protein [Longimicrobium sp.]